MNWRVGRTLFQKKTITSGEEETWDRKWIREEGVGGRGEPDLMLVEEKELKP